MKKESVLVIIGAIIFGASAITAMAIDHARNILVCRDQRLYMDGSYNIRLETGGLSPHSTLKIFKLKNMKNEKIDEQAVSLERRLKDGKAGEMYTSSAVQFFIPDSPQMTRPREVLSQLEGEVHGTKLQVNLLCSQQKRSS